MEWGVDLGQWDSQRVRKLHEFIELHPQTNELEGTLNLSFQNSNLINIINKFTVRRLKMSEELNEMEEVVEEDTLEEASVLLLLREIVILN